MYFRNELAAFDGRTLECVVEETWIRGRKIFNRKTGFDEEHGPSCRIIFELRRLKAVRVM